MWQPIHPRSAMIGQMIHQTPRYPDRHQFDSSLVPPCPSDRARRHPQRQAMQIITLIAIQVSIRWASCGVKQHLRQNKSKQQYRRGR